MEGNNANRTGGVGVAMADTVTRALDEGFLD